MPLQGAWHGEDGVVSPPSLCLLVVDPLLLLLQRARFHAGQHPHTSACAGQSLVFSEGKMVLVSRTFPPAASSGEIYWMGPAPSSLKPVPVLQLAIHAMCPQGYLKICCAARYASPLRKADFQQAANKESTAQSLLLLDAVKTSGGNCPREARRLRALCSEQGGINDFHTSFSVAPEGSARGACGAAPLACPQPCTA